MLVHVNYQCLTDIEEIGLTSALLLFSSATTQTRRAKEPRLIIVGEN